MSKNKILILTSVIIFFLKNSNGQIDSVSDFGLNGKVIEVFYRMQNASFVEDSLIEKEGVISYSFPSYLKFDNDGCLLIEEYSSPRGTVLKKREFIFDKNKTRIKAIEYEEESDSIIKHLKEYKYDLDQHLIEVKEFEKEKNLIEAEKFIYENGLLVKREILDTANVLVNYFLYEYSANSAEWSKKTEYNKNDKIIDIKCQFYNVDGSLKELKTFDGENILINNIKYFYDAMRNLVREEHYIHDDMNLMLDNVRIFRYNPAGKKDKYVELQGNGDTLGIKKYEYNKNGYIAYKCCYHKNDSLVYERCYEYDTLNRQINKRYFNFAENIYEMTKMEYDTLNRVIKKTMTGGKYVVYEMTQRFDTYDNWIYKTEYFESSELSEPHIIIHKRKIKYYQ